MEEKMLYLILNSCYQFINSQISKSENDIVFPCYSSTDKNIKNPVILPPEIATTILWLFFVADPADIISRAVKSVESQLNSQETINFFLRSSISKYHLTLPDDLETSAWAILTLKKFGYCCGKRLAQLIIETVDKEENICLYPHPNQEHPQRKDCFSTIPILYLLKHEGCAENIVYKNNLNWVLTKLRNQDYQKGSRYYPSGLIFLFLLSLFDDILDNPEDKKMLKETVLGEEIPIATIDLVVCSATCLQLGLIEKAKVAFEKLLNKQDNFLEGKFSSGALFQFGSNKSYIGSPTITAIFIAHLIKLFMEVEKC